MDKLRYDFAPGLFQQESSERNNNRLNLLLALFSYPFDILENSAILVTQLIDLYYFGFSFRFSKEK